MSEDLVNFEINGIPLQARKGAVLIDVADANGIVIPRFCYHKKLSVAANCRMCLVEVEKAPKPLPACATPVAEGMKVFTRSPKAQSAQKSVMEFLLINHPLDCPVCDQGGECELQDVSVGFGSDVSHYSEPRRAVREKDIGPLVATSMTRCIHCTRCVRFGEEIAGVREMGATGRSEFMEIGTWVEKSLGHEMAANIIDLCPVGALTAKPSQLRFRPWELSRHGSVAPHDAIGSNIDIHTRNGEIMRVVPRDNEAINETWISDRDRFSYAGNSVPDRLLHPMVREGDAWRETDWETALARVVECLRKVPAAERAGLASPTSTLEELYLFQNLLRATGTPHVDHRLRQTDFMDQDRAPACPWLGVSIADLGTLDAALLIGSDVRREAPIAAHRLRQATLRGGRVAAINPRDFGFHFPLSGHLVADPRAMLVELAGVAAAVAGEGRVPVPQTLSQIVSSVTPSDAQRAIAATLTQGERGLVLLGTLAHQHPQFSILRALATYVASGTDCVLGYLPEGGNAAGAWLAGAVPHRGAAGKAVEALGNAASALLASPRKAYVLLGVEPELDCDNPAQALAAMHAADTVVCLTPFASETMKSYAQVMLPVAIFAETSGTFVNVAGHWQSFAGAGRAPGEARPAWKVLRVLGNLFGISGFDYDSSEEVRDEIKSLFPQDYRLDNAYDFGHATLNLPPEPATLLRGGSVPMYACDALVRRSRPLQETPIMKDQACARICAAQAEASGLAAVARVLVRQGGADAVLPLVIDESIPKGCVWVPTGLVETAGLGAAFDTIELQRM